MWLKLVWHFLKDPRVPLTRKIIAGLPFLYVLSPIDLRPDWLPVIGWFDDIIVLAVGTLGVWWLIRSYRQRCHQTPPPSEDDKTVDGEYRIIK